MNESANDPPDEENVFGRALALPAGERDAYLDQACAGHAALRARVEALLKSNDEADSLLDALPGGVVRTSLTRPPPEETPGILIGRYKLLQKIGEGGCGVVYMAEQEEPVRRRVALKVIKLGMDTREVVARFEAERQALALMDHPNIARVLDGGATATGRPYFVMELVRGVPLTTYCDEQCLSTTARLGLFMQVCSAVQHAHQKGIIHRDLKPSNILVTVNDGAPVPKVIDFGIAKATQGRLTDRTLFTAFEQFIGTPAYMSPEQAELTSLDVDTRSDIYSLGVLLYELLTGQTPFDARSLLQSGLDEIRRVIREVEPPRPSARLSTLPNADRATVAKLRATAPIQLSIMLRGDLDWIVMRCLEKDRRRRYETANSLAEDIRRHLECEPVIARPPSMAYRVGKLVRRNKLVFASISAVGLAVFIGLISSLLLMGKANRLANGREAAHRFFTEDLLAQAGGWAQAEQGFTSEPNLTLRQALDRASARIESRFKGRPTDEEAAIRTLVGKVYYKLGDYPSAVTHLERALALRQRTLGPTHRETLSIMSFLGSSHQFAGQWDQARALFEENLRLARATFGPDHALTLSAMHDLALSHSEGGRLTEAITLEEETLRLRQAALGADHPATLVLMGNLAGDYLKADRVSEGLKLADETLRRAKAALGPNNPRTMYAMGILASAYTAGGRRPEAIQLREEAMRLTKANLGPDHPDTLSAMNALANAYRASNRVAEALPIHEDVLRRRQATLGAEHPSTLTSMDSLALAYQEAGRLAEALPLAEETLQLMKARLGPDHPSTLAAMNNLALVWGKSGRREKAIPLFEESLRLKKAKLGPDHVDTLISMGNLAETHERAGNVSQAEALRREVLASRLRKDEADAVTLARAQFALGWCLLSQQKFTEAEPLFRSALAICEKKLPGDWRLFTTRSALGSALAGQGKFTVAEPLLLSGYEGQMEREAKIESVNRIYLKANLEHLVRLYTDWDRSEPAARWRRQLDQWNRSETGREASVDSPVK